MQLEDIKKLADLARIDMTEEEMIGIAKDFDSILAYVGQVKEVANIYSNDINKNDYFLTNVMREDEVTNESGGYQDKILKQFPDSQDNFLKVKQIL